jgi:hypothetical protein
MTHPVIAQSSATNLRFEAGSGSLGEAPGVGGGSDHLGVRPVCFGWCPDRPGLTWGAAPLRDRRRRAHADSEPQVGRLRVRSGLLPTELRRAHFSRSAHAAPTVGCAPPRSDASCRQGARVAMLRRDHRGCGQGGGGARRRGAAGPRSAETNRSRPALARRAAARPRGGSSGGHLGGAAPPGFVCTGAGEVLAVSAPSKGPATDGLVRVRGGRLTVDDAPSSAPSSRRCRPLRDRAPSDGC